MTLEENYSNAVKKIDSFIEPRRNWDGHDAKTIDKQIISKAKEFIKNVSQIITRFNLKNEFPDIIPTPEGGIQFEWEVNDIELEIEFNKNGISVFEYNNNQDIGKELVIEMKERNPTKKLQQLREYMQNNHHTAYTQSQLRYILGQNYYTVKSNINYLLNVERSIKKVGNMYQWV